jgi:hypothetical protein
MQHLKVPARSKGDALLPVRADLVQPQGKTGRFQMLEHLKVVHGIIITNRLLKVRSSKTGPDSAGKASGEEDGEQSETPQVTTNRKSSRSTSQGRARSTKKIKIAE